MPRVDATPRAAFLPALEGLRAVACCGIIVTHVAFQTGADTGGLFQRMMARTDFFVPVFFALSGFLLWRRHREEWGTGAASIRGIQGYYVKRIGRIMPAYLATVVVVLVLLPVAGRPGIGVIAANLTLTQIYVSGGLVGGLTHLWSLCVEMAFYLTLPLVGLVLGGRRWGVRVGLIAGGALVSLAWAFIPAFADPPPPGGINPHIMPPAFSAWFAVGLLAAEFERVIRPAEVEWVRRLRPVFWGVALLALIVAASDGPEGLTHATPAEFARRTTYGVVFAAALLLPYALAPGSRWLESPVMQALGRWSYGIFLWHMAVLSLVFDLLGVPLFSGHTAVVFLATLGLTIPVAALSYALVEEPARRWINAWWKGRSGG